MIGLGILEYIENGDKIVLWAFLFSIFGGIGKGINLSSIIAQLSRYK